MKTVIYIYIIGSIGAILFMFNYVPDVIKAAKSDCIKGVTVISQIILFIELLCASVTNIYFKNYPFIINDFVSMVLVAILIYQRKKKLS